MILTVFSGVIFGAAFRGAEKRFTRGFSSVKTVYKISLK